MENTALQYMFSCFDLIDIFAWNTSWCTGARTWCMAGCSRCKARQGDSMCSTLAYRCLSCQGFAFTGTVTKTPLVSFTFVVRWEDLDAHAPLWRSCSPPSILGTKCRQMYTIWKFTNKLRSLVKEGASFSDVWQCLWSWGGLCCRTKAWLAYHCALLSTLHWRQRCAVYLKVGSWVTIYRDHH